MTPVHQRIIDPHRGDCQTACVATLLDLPYEAVPTWLADAMDAYLAHQTDPQGRRAQPHDWHDAMVAWLRARNLHLLSLSWDHVQDWRALPGAFCIASMPSQRYPDSSHAVVARFTQDATSGAIRCDIVHDPNPGNTPYPLAQTPSRLAFLVPLDPAMPRMAP